jgi:SNF2 family DNA or RNA helicase
MRCDPASIGMYTQIFDYQINNLNYMINREENPLSEVFTNCKLLVLANGLIFNYNERKFIKLDEMQMIPIKGGVIADDPGVGKTLQLLTLCWLRRVPTAIIFPDHLGASGHWEMEICKHFMHPEKFTEFVKLYTFTQFSQLTSEEINMFERIIIDEAHETYTCNSDDTDVNKKMKNVLYGKLTATKCKYKWLVTGTPFASGADSTFKIISLLTDDKNVDSHIKFTYETFIRNQIYDPTLELLFRKNIKENVVSELHLPDIKYNNILLNFSEFEKELYDAEISANIEGDQIDPTRRISRNIDMELLRKICSNVMIACSGEGDLSVRLSVSQLRPMFLEKFKIMYQMQDDILTSYYEIVKRLYIVHAEIIALLREKKPIKIVEIMETIRSREQTNPDGCAQMQIDYTEYRDSFSRGETHDPTLKEIEHNISHYEGLIASQKKIVESRKTVYDRYVKIVEVIEEASKKEEHDDNIDDDIDYDKMCPICADSLKHVVALYECGHFFCKICSDSWRKKSDLCVCCRKRTPDENITVITNSKHKPAYGSKIEYIIEFMRSSPKQEQFVIFTQFENSIRSINAILANEGVECCVYKDWVDIVDFREKCKKVIILSSAQQPSGLDLSFVSNVIMMEPLNGEFSFRRDIEKQIIGRVHRIKQTKSINVYRMVIRNTIEELLYVDL